MTPFLTSSCVNCQTSRSLTLLLSMPETETLEVRTIRIIFPWSGVSVRKYMGLLFVRPAKWIRMDQNRSEWIKMDRNRSKWIKLDFSPAKCEASRCFCVNGILFSVTLNASWRLISGITLIWNVKSRKMASWFEMVAVKVSFERDISLCMYTT